MLLLSSVLAAYFRVTVSGDSDHSGEMMIVNATVAYSYGLRAVAVFGSFHVISHVMTPSPADCSQTFPAVAVFTFIYLYCLLSCYIMVAFKMKDTLS